MKILHRGRGKLSEEVHRTRLPGGLPAVLLRKRGFRRKVALLAVRYGSIDVEFTPPGYVDRLLSPHGVAHFIEHQLFKKQSGDQLVEFSRYGSVANADTEYASTSYYFTTTEHFEECLTLLLQFVFSPYFNGEFVERERSIIEQERRMHEDTPENAVYQNLLLSLYHRHPVRHEIVGTRESLDEITADDLRICYEAFYRPSGMILVLVGDLDPLVSLRCASKVLADKPLPSAREAGRTYAGEPSTCVRELHLRQLKVSRPKFLMGFKEASVGLQGPALRRRDLSTALSLDAVFGKGSHGYSRLYEEGLVDDTFAFGHLSHPSFAFSFIGSDTSRHEELRERLVRELRLALRSGIRRRTLDRMRRKYYGRWLRVFDSPEALAFAYANNVFRQVDLFELPELLRSLKPRDLEERLESHLLESHHAVSVVTPLQMI